MRETSSNRRTTSPRKFILPFLALVLGLLLLLCSGCIPMLRWTTNVRINNGTEQTETFIAQIPDGSNGTFVLWCGTTDLYAQHVNSLGIPLWGLTGRIVAETEATVLNEESNLAAVAADGAGGIVVAWTEPRSGDQDIYAQRIGAAGNRLWGTGKQVCTKPGDQVLGAVVAGGVPGEAIVTWRDDHADGNTVIYAQRLNASGSPVWADGGVAVCDVPGAKCFLDSVPDGAGGVIAAWRDERVSASSSDNRDVYAQRIDKNGSLAWQESAVEITRDAYVYGFSLASDGRGGALFSWYDQKTERGGHAQRVDSSGASLWGTGGVLVCDNGFDIVGDSTGGAIVAWSARSGEDDHIFAQKITPGGNLSWGTAGMPVCTATGIKSTPALSSDSAGGAVLAWTDGRNIYIPPGQPIYNDLNYDAFAARVDSSGKCAWLMNISPNIYLQDALDVVPSGTGGAIVAWQTDTNLHWMYGLYDISVTRLTGWEVTSANQKQLLAEYNKQVAEYNKKLDAESRSLMTR